MSAYSEDVRALLVAYMFPPVGGVGVQRVLKLTKYLPRHGVRPTVLTVENPSVPLRDEGLLRQVPEGVEIVRARTFEPSYAVKNAAWNATATKAPTVRSRAMKSLTAVARQFLIPDPQLLWFPEAARALIPRLVRREDDVVMISAPPFSQFLLGPLSRLGRKVGVVLDYRDEWDTTRAIYEMASKSGELLGSSLENAFVRSAHVITTATPEFRENLLRRFPFLDPGSLHVVPNGYDPEDFPKDLPPPPHDRFVVTYAGTLFKQNSPHGFLGAVRLLHEREPELAKLLDVEFIGRIVDTELPLFEGTEALGVRRTGFMNYADVLRRLSASHLTLCTLDEVPGVDRVFPAKIFELMYLGRPTLITAPSGALTRLAKKHQLGAVFPPRDAAGVAAFLVDRLREFKAGRYATTAAASNIEQFDRRNTARRFAEIFREARDRATRA